MDKHAIYKRLEQIDELPTLPVVAIELNRMLQDYDIGIDAVAEMIERDQAMVPKILKLVNSAFFGLRSKIANIRHAVSLLGFNTVRNAVVSVAVIRALRGLKGMENFDATEFWKHSLAVAVTARLIAAESKAIPREDAFTAGLLHDVGKLVLSHFFTEAFAAIWQECQSRAICFREAEVRLKSVSHARIGAILAKRWALPEALVLGIRNHHAPLSTQDHFATAAVVQAADLLVNVVDQADARDSVRAQIPPEAVTLLTPAWDRFDDWQPLVTERIAVATAFFIEASEEAE